MADRVALITVHSELQEQDRLFIESRDMFFLTSVDDDGQPSCSYRGGEPGFVRVIDSKTVVFPSYDGNGMFISMGNIGATAKIGMLFIDFEKPNRLRLHGAGSFREADPLLDEYPGADLIVRVARAGDFRQLPALYSSLPENRRVALRPQGHSRDAFREWKRIDALQDVLPPLR